MTRSILSGAILALVVGACSAGSTPPSAPAPASTTAASPTAAAAPATPGPTPTAPAISAAVAFDGKTCTYAGPADVARGSRMTFSLVNTPEAMQSSRGSALAVAELADGTTWEQVLKDTQTRKATNIPGYFLNPATIPLLYPQPAATGATLSVTMSGNLYFVGVATAPDEGNREYACALIKVLDR